MDRLVDTARWLGRQSESLVALRGRAGVGVNLGFAAAPFFLWSARTNGLFRTATALPMRWGGFLGVVGMSKGLLVTSCFSTHDIVSIGFGVALGVASIR